MNYPIIYIILIIIPLTYALRCSRTPDGPGAGKTPADGRFHIKIVDNPAKFTPGANYIITLEGIDSGGTRSIKHKFSGFILAVTKKDNENDYTVPTAGIFSPAQNDIYSKIICANMVTHTTTTPKHEIQVLWTAPAAGTGCITFRATVIEHRDVWYMDDGPLSKEFCEDEQIIDDTDIVNEQCCACSEAKYELTFEGQWSRNTHPKDFPTNSWLTKFSDIIGASHNNDYRIWMYGDLASEGVRQVAELGVTKTLESELKEKSENIRTIIKARGLSYPNVTGKTFAVFRVDPKRHLVSIISMIDPSPDWFVGVSGLELCLSNCTWTEKKTIELYPWDAGTDAGPSYMSIDQPIVPPDNIRRIKSDLPNDPRSPFYDPDGTQMKPIAKLNLLRQRLYEKECVSVSNEQVDSGGKGTECATTGWSKWTKCNASCGKGYRYRQRQYINITLAMRIECKKELTKREECYEQQPNCYDDTETNDSGNDGYLENVTEPECALTQWSEWTECKPKCGKGKQYQERRYVYKRGKKHCEGPGNHPILRRERDCTTNYDDCIGDIITPDPLNSDNTDTIDNNNEQSTVIGRTSAECQYSNWTTGPCSVTCGKGYKIKTQNPINNDLNNCPTIQKTVSCQKKKCKIPDFCFDDPIMGNCRIVIEKWFYNRNTTSCATFSWTCSNHGNKFSTKRKCLEICGPKND